MLQPHGAFFVLLSHPTTIPSPLCARAGVEPQPQGQILRRSETLSLVLTCHSTELSSCGLSKHHSHAAASGNSPPKPWHIPLTPTTTTAPCSHGATVTTVLSGKLGLIISRHRASGSPAAARHSCSARPSGDRSCITHQDTVVVPWHLFPHSLSMAAPSRGPHMSPAHPSPGDSAYHPSLGLPSGFGAAKTCCGCSKQQPGKGKLGTHMCAEWALPREQSGRSGANEWGTNACANCAPTPGLEGHSRKNKLGDHAWINWELMHK